ncbi:MAG: phosphonate C-P lyase system protein PhnG [Beijerinckiaceae bacterium]|nr:phosphonate C-P lyase system protein PhnG [Beijerinckiaceae bacterium]MCZ8299976.1 phosphonate C-P lyase system protein PhnG [Beijerinckiaceae bacterium]
MQSNQPMARRQGHFAILARAALAEVEAVLADAPAIPPFTVLKQPETGTIMVEGRAGGGGRRFNLGEATMTRCAIRLEDGTLGFSYALGRDMAKARKAAVLDALLQNEPPEGPMHRAMHRLAEHQKQAREEASRKAAATKVEFFTMVRGEG